VFAKIGHITGVPLSTVVSELQKLPSIEVRLTAHAELYCHCLNHATPCPTTPRASSQPMTSQHSAPFPDPIPIIFQNQILIQKSEILQCKSMHTKKAQNNHVK